MCGRFVLHTLVGDLHNHFGLFSELDLRPRYNISPSQTVPIVRQQEGARELALCQWGLVPSWAKSLPATRPINARAETVAEKPFFRSAFKRRRCLIPANGYYEWKQRPGGKQPYYLRVADANLMAFAGIWDRWEHEGEIADTFAIITTRANETTAPVHDRMPVILDPGQYAVWLDTGGASLLTPYAGLMVSHPVSTRVNSPRNDGAELIEPLRSDKAAPE